MSYQVLARKWRPKTFDTVIGQEHVVRALRNALQLNRLHHAYLFSGTRGVGKTTLARILAKCLNCDVGTTATPCGQCSACTQIDQGKFVDLMEVDAASRTGIDDMRELLDNVQYLPAMGRFKIYLIDEVHMLSISSFNALLKTLEEPPQHVKFFFATTHPQKLPVTILSRCLQFNLTRLTPLELQQHLVQLLESESVPFEELAAHQIALSAEGSVRDALSLLDQAIAYGSGSLKLAEVEAMLGIASRGHVVDLLRCVIENNPGSLLEKIAALYALAVDFENLLGDVTTLLHEVAVCQAVSITDLSGQFKAEEIAELAQSMTPEDVQLFYQIALQGKRDLPVLPDFKNAFEMTMLRMLSFRPLLDVNDTSTPSKTKDLSSSAVPTNRAARNPTANAASENTVSTKQHVVEAPEVHDVAPQTTSVTDQAEVKSEAMADDTASAQLDEFTGTAGWNRLIDLLKVQGPVRELCCSTSLTVKSPTQVCLTIDPQYEILRADKRETEIVAAFKDFFGKEINVQFEVAVSTGETPTQLRQQKEQQEKAQVYESIKKNSVVKELQSKMGATIVPKSIKSIKSIKRNAGEP